MTKVTTNANKILCMKGAYPKSLQFKSFSSSFSVPPDLLAGSEGIWPLKWYRWSEEMRRVVIEMIQMATRIRCPTGMKCGFYMMHIDECVERVINLIRTTNKVPFEIAAFLNEVFYGMRIRRVFQSCLWSRVCEEKRVVEMIHMATQEGRRRPLKWYIWSRRTRKKEGQKSGLNAFVFSRHDFQSVLKDWNREIMQCETSNMIKQSKSCNAKSATWANKQNHAMRSQQHDQTSKIMQCESATWSNKQNRAMRNKQHDQTSKIVQRQMSSTMINQSKIHNVMQCQRSNMIN